MKNKETPLTKEEFMEGFLPHRDIVKRYVTLGLYTINSKLQAYQGHTVVPSKINVIMPFSGDTRAGEEALDVLFEMFRKAGWCEIHASLLPEGKHLITLNVE